MFAARLASAAILGLVLCGAPAVAQEERPQRVEAGTRAESSGASVSRVSNRNGVTVISSRSSGGTSRIVTGKPAPNAFVLTVQMTLRPVEGVQGRVDFGPYQGGSAGAGYRLSCAAGGDGGPALELLRVGAEGGVTLLAAYEGPLRLDDGKEREIRWTRDGEGRMAVSIDGEEVLTATDRDVTGPFDGVAFVNTGGAAEVSALEIAGGE